MERTVVNTTVEEMFPLVAGEPDTFRLDAVQGNGEARTELHQEVLLGSTTAGDAVMRQESGLAAELDSEAGQDDGGDW